MSEGKGLAVGWTGVPEEERKMMTTGVSGKNHEEEVLADALAAYVRKLQGMVDVAGGGLAVTLDVDYDQDYDRVSVSLTMQPPFGSQRIGVFPEKMASSARSRFGDPGAFVDVANALAAWTSRRVTEPVS